MNRFQFIYQLFKNQGARYVLFRVAHEISRKSGLLASRFPVNPPERKFIGLEEWRRTKPAFFFEDKMNLHLPKYEHKKLEEKYLNFLEGNILYFTAYYQSIGQPIDWLTHPETGYTYSVKTHWTRIEDFSQEAGDIKYVWEKSRFSFLLDLIRYDYHYGKDCAELVFSNMDSWMDANPINMGPNYRCSQEISVRVLHWIFALYYYSNHSALTEVRFNRLMHFIYWQLHHVRKNIQFSRISVRNNHAITEVMMLYFSGLLFPFMPDTARWKEKGKAWLEKEVEYQVYPDGTFLQFSHNYHRVLMQLLTWTQMLSVIHKEKFSHIFYERSKATARYIRSVIDPNTGYLPNYGANDGALFFRLNDAEYRDYRSQLNALWYANHGETCFEDHKEDIEWLTSTDTLNVKSRIDLQEESTASFPQGGIYTLREKDTFTFIKCATYKDRPAHADNLHLDIWYKGQNLLRDAGTYKYNTTPGLVSYFNGTRSHCTVTLGDHDQMLKGKRFIWFYWTKALEASWHEEPESYSFHGTIKAFRHIDKDITHTRTVKKLRDIPEWWVTDEINDTHGHTLKQWWHPAPAFFEIFSIRAFDEQENEIPCQRSRGYYSSHYGVMEEAEDIYFQTKGKKMTTRIALLENAWLN